MGGDKGQLPSAVAAPRGRASIAPGRGAVRRCVTLALVVAVVASLAVALATRGRRVPLVVYYQRATSTSPHGRDTAHLTPDDPPIVDPTVFVPGGPEGTWAQDPSALERVFARLIGREAHAEYYPAVRADDARRFDTPTGWEVWIIGADDIPSAAEATRDLVGRLGHHRGAVRRSSPAPQ